MPLSPALVAEADAATASGNLRRAEELLLKASEDDPNSIETWLKLAAIQRASGRDQAALATVHRALSISPLDFTALLLRASLLDRHRRPDAAAAWSHALAQKPDRKLPEHLEAIVSLAETRVRQWTDDRERKMIEALDQFSSAANPDEQGRLERFKTNILRRTRHYHSEPTHFHFPGLPEREFYPRSQFPWLERLEQATDMIVAEMQDVMAAERAELVPYVQYENHQPLDQWRDLNHNPDWTAIHLLKNGESIKANVLHAPRTVELLAKFDQPLIAGAAPNSMFSLLAPNTTIPPHVGVNNARLVCHLPLIIPEGCWFRVGAEKRHWKKGQAFVFDDTIEHEARNPTDQLRVVLIFDVWHPDLTMIEREGIAKLVAADDTVATPSATDHDARAL